MRSIFAVAILLTLAACASRPSSIPASYVSHDKYAGRDCGQLGQGLTLAQAELTRVSAQQNTAATADAVGVFLLGIPFSALTGDHKADVAKWKGEVEALTTASHKAGCIK